jgi:hypothetical protein
MGQLKREKSSLISIKPIFYSWLQKVPVFQLVGNIEPA